MGFKAMPPGGLQPENIFKTDPLSCKIFQIWHIFGKNTSNQQQEICHVVMSSHDSFQFGPVIFSWQRELQMKMAGLEPWSLALVVVL